jgi:hypothetical protein
MKTIKDSPKQLKALFPLESLPRKLPGVTIDQKGAEDLLGLKKLLFPFFGMLKKKTCARHLGSPKTAGKFFQAERLSLELSALQARLSRKPRTMQGSGGKSPIEVLNIGFLGKERSHRSLAHRCSTCCNHSFSSQ